MRKLRCMLGWHGPHYTTNLLAIGPYSVRTAHDVRLCPHCFTRWRIYSKLDDWRKVEEHGEVDYLTKWE